MKKNILVVGSLNMDLVIETPRIPVSGETIRGSGFSMITGGKGANQASAAGKLGGSTAMLGAVGLDQNSGLLLDGLNQCGVHTGHILRKADAPCGVAVIVVCGGDNRIILDSGANGTLSRADLDAHEELFAWADYVLLQLEIPMETVCRAAALAKANNAVVVLNPAPMQELPEQLIADTDIFVPNEHEAAQYLGYPVDTREAVERAIDDIRSKGITQAVITLGAKGCAYSCGEKTEFLDAFSTQVVDTTAAGDCFVGAMVTALAAGKPLRDAIEFATAASAITVSRFGAGVSIPTLEEVQAFLRKERKG